MKSIGPPLANIDTDTTKNGRYLPVPILGNITTFDITAYQHAKYTKAKLLHHLELKLFFEKCSNEGKSVRSYGC